MKIKNNLDDILHRMRCKLFPNYLPANKGKYIARTNNEAALTVEQVCAILKNRGGFTGNYNDLVAYVNQFLDEFVYQLCDGYAVSTRFFSVAPTIHGIFDSASEANDRKKHPIGFTMRTTALLRELARQILVEVDEISDGSGFIDRFQDLDLNQEQNTVVPGNMFTVMGHKIKLFGDDPGVGLYFVSAENASKAIKVERIGENTPSKILGIAPEAIFRQNRIEIRTQFTGSSSTQSKVPRVITSDFIVEGA